MEATQRFCERCKRTKAVTSFYRSNNTEQFPDGYINICKDCLTMHINNFDPATYVDAIQLLDIPYVPDEWNKLLTKYAANNPEKLNGSTVFGRYVAKMHLKKWKDFRWKDNDLLKELEESKTRAAMMQQGYDDSEIARTLAENQINAAAPPPGYQAPSLAADYAPFPDPAEEVPIDLTPEDISYLQLKWGKNYRPMEWVQLETLYNEMMSSYDIQTAGHKDNLKLVCKASLKANQLMDLGD